MTHSRREKHKQGTNHSFTFEVHHRIDDIADLWTSMPSKNDFFQSIPYLRSLEFSLREQINFHYYFVYDQDRLIGKFTLHQMKLNTVKAVKNLRDRGVFKIFGSSLLDFNVNVAGSAIQTCLDMFVIDADYEKSAVYVAFAKHLAQQMKDGQIKKQAILFKDLSWDLSNISNRLHALQFQPTMVMDIDANWHTFEDYLAALKSKYRVNFKKRLKKATHFEFKELQLEEIQEHLQKIHELYVQVAKSADFYSLLLPPEYFPQLKKQCGEQFKLFGVFEGLELMAFYTTFELDDILEAHYLGHDEHKKTNNHIYFSILMEMLKTAILSGKKKLILGRTAMEIKSSIGAYPVPTYNYIYHPNKTIDKLIPRLTGRYTPTKDWQPRQPFKK